MYNVIIKKLIVIDSRDDTSNEIMMKFESKNDVNENIITDGSLNNDCFGKIIIGEE